MSRLAVYALFYLVATALALAAVVTALGMLMSTLARLGIAS